MTEPVRALLHAVLRGEFPPVDLRTEVVPQPPGPVAALLAFTGHHVVAADVDPAWVASLLPGGDVDAPLQPAFVAALAGRLGRTFDAYDLVLAAPAIDGPPPVDLVRVDDLSHHPRVARALRYRTDVAAFETETTGGGDGVVLVGRGLAGRWEAAFEVAPGARGRGLGRLLVTAARHLVPAGEHVFVQVAPGNVASVRAVLGAGGYVAVGGELLFPET